jgi:hypothetical protein
MKIIFTTILLFGFQLIYAQGIKFDKDRYEKLPIYEPQKSQGYASITLPKKISFREYCPNVSNQRDVSTCVGWATSYALLSTQQNILMGETNYYRKLVRVMDPNFVYALIRDYNDSWCQNGTYMLDAMDVLNNYGSKPLYVTPWLSCNSTTEIDKFALAIASIYSIKTYYKLNDVDDLISSLKYTLNNKKPIAIGMNITKSFATGSGILYGKWTPNSNEKIEGAHAMCIIGYDDNKYGGSFEVMNSYGDSFGDKGFVWISYNDMKKYMQEAYIIDLETEKNGYRIGNCSLGDCSNNYSRYKYNTGEVYEGEFLKGYRNGWGILLHTDNSFYVGGFSNGYKHGWGIYCNPSNGNYYKTYFNYGTLKSSQNYQGFTGTEEDKKLDGLIDVLQGIISGKEVNIKSDEYQYFVDSIKPEVEPIQIEKK